MDKVYPIKVTVNAKGERFPLKFAEGAASYIEESERLSFEVTSEGLILKGIWDLDLELAIYELSRKIGKTLENSDYTIECIEGERTLEPVMTVGVITPEEYMGDVVGDLNRRRGMVSSMDDHPIGKVVHSQVPLAEMFGYATDLRSATQGRACYSMEFSEYAEAPSNIMDEIVKVRSGGD